MIGILNSIFKAIGSVLGLIINMLPDSPFIAMVENVDVGWMGVINWLIPIPVLLYQLSLYIMAVSVYYLIRLVLRWLKLAGS